MHRVLLPLVHEICGALRHTPYWHVGFVFDHRPVQAMGNAVVGGRAEQDEGD